ESLGVSPALIEEHGAVSEPVARQMARAARERFGATYALSLTGIAGPDGGTADKPVGLIYLGLAKPEGVDVRTLNFGGDQPRPTVRSRAAKTALNLLRRELL
ncbi:MAG: CinA family protein, partial [Phycisphaerae bacterium]